MQNNRKISGYTLIELMLTITILAIVVSLAVPPMQDFFTRHKNETVGRKLFDLIMLSRSKAYGHSEIYTLCPSTDGESCGTDWAQGALVFVDRDGNGERATDERIERVLPKLDDDASLEWRSFNSKSYLQYRPSGLTLNQNGNFAYCPPNGEEKYGWIIVLNATGRPYFGKDSDGDGIVENGSGDNLSCTTES